MVGTVKQRLYVKGIPQGLTLRVTHLNLLPPDPPKEWRATLYDQSGNQRYAPFIINPSVNDGFVGEVKLYGTHAFPSNSLGARLEILWELTGSPTRGTDSEVLDETTHRSSEHDQAVEHPAAKPADSEEAGPTVDPNDPDSWATKLSTLGSIAVTEEPARTGRFIVETTQWGLIQRPDYAAVVYQVGSATPLRVVSKIAATIIDQPYDALFVIGLNTNDQTIGINATQEKAVADTLVSYAIAGIFYAHEKAIGWVFGKFW